MEKGFAKKCTEQLDGHCMQPLVYVEEVASFACEGGRKQAREIKKSRA
jgi:hypothetical protein